MKHPIKTVNKSPQRERENPTDFPKSAGQQNWNQVGKGGNVRSINDVPTKERYGGAPPQYIDTSD